MLVVVLAVAEQVEQFGVVDFATRRRVARCTATNFSRGSCVRSPQRGHQKQEWSLLGAGDPAARLSALHGVVAGRASRPAGSQCFRRSTWPSTARAVDQAGDAGAAVSAVVVGIGVEALAVGHPLRELPCSRRSKQPTL